MIRTLLFFVAISTLGCGGSSNDDKNNSPNIQPQSNIVISDNLPIPNNTLVNSYKVLLVGNSHVSANNLPYLIQVLIKYSKPNSQVLVELAGGAMFLDEKIDDGITLEKINSDAWSHIIFQAQKYSQSGTKVYSTKATEKWLSISKNINATPILFPEHPQRGNPAEAEYVHKIHLGIVNKQKSCIAPIGLGWNQLLAEFPDIELYASDGNHAGYIGSVFTALIFYQVITGELADSLPTIEELLIPEEVQEQLGRVASQILDQHQACVY